MQSGTGSCPESGKCAAGISAPHAALGQTAVRYACSGFLPAAQYFSAVGLAHLLADDGLVNTLRDAGYIVELVTYNG